jgi:hypothetical protein
MSKLDIAEKRRRRRRIKIRFTTTARRKSTSVRTPTLFGENRHALLTRTS